MFAIPCKNHAILLQKTNVRWARALKGTFKNFSCPKKGALAPIGMQSQRRLHPFDTRGASKRYILTTLKSQLGAIEMEGKKLRNSNHHFVQ